MQELAENGNVFMMEKTSFVSLDRGKINFDHIKPMMDWFIARFSKVSLEGASKRFHLTASKGIETAHQSLFRACANFHENKNPIFPANNIDLLPAIEGASPVYDDNTIALAFQKFSSEPFSISAAQLGVCPIRLYSE